MENHTALQENQPVPPEGSGSFARKYANSFLIKLTALFAMIYGAFNFYGLFIELREHGFAADFWYVNLFYVFGYVFLCVGLFSTIGKNKPLEKLVSNLHTAQIGFGLLGTVNLFYLCAMFVIYFTSPYYEGRTLQTFFQQTGIGYQLTDYVASILACLFAVLLVQNVIGALKGDPAGKMPAILTGSFSLISGVTLLLFVISTFSLVNSFSTGSFWKTASDFFLQEATMTVLAKILFTLCGAVCAFMWIPRAVKINRHILEDETPSPSEESNEPAQEADVPDNSEKAADTDETIKTE